MANSADSWRLSSKAAVTFSPSDAKKCAIYVFAVFGVFGGMVVLFGLVGNTLTIIIMLKDKSQTTMSRLLVFLAIIDGTSLLLGGLFYTFRGIFEFFPASKVAFYRVYGITFPLSFVSTKVLNQISSYLTMIIAIHRYLSICHPLKMKTLCCSRRMTVYMTATVVVSVLCYIPSSFGIYESKRLANGVYTVRTTAFQQSNVNKALVILRFVLNFLIPLPCLTFMAYRIVRSLRTSKFAKLTAKEKATRSLTWSILSFIVIFIICKLPEALFGLYSLVVPIYKYTSCPHPIHYIMNLPNLFIFINAASNVIVYTLCMQGFRRKMISLLTCMRSSSSVSPVEQPTPATTAQRQIRN